MGVLGKTESALELVPVELQDSCCVLSTAASSQRFVWPSNTHSARVSDTLFALSHEPYSALPTVLDFLRSVTRLSIHLAQALNVASAHAASLDALLGLCAPPV